MSTKELIQAELDTLSDEDLEALYTLTLQRHLSISHFISIGYNVFMSSVLTVFIALTP